MSDDSVQENTEAVDEFKLLYKRHRNADITSLKHDDVVFDTRSLNYRGPYTFKLSHSDDIWNVVQLPGLAILPNSIGLADAGFLVGYTLDELVPNDCHRSNLTALMDLPKPFDLFDDHLQCHIRANGRPISMAKIRKNHLRWITLGGQYDWTNKVYPSWNPGDAAWPGFPKPLSDFLRKAVPERYKMMPQAAIVNFYSPGDTLSPHQDVAEKSRAPLVSLSLGCSCVFYVGLERSCTTMPPLAILLHSGDMIIMSGKSRHAFHGVGRVIPQTCPDFSHYLQSEHANWIQNKRVNINVRQMV